MAVLDVNDNPTGSVTISGTASLGYELTADIATLADADGLGVLSYQWEADGEVIVGETSSALILGQLVVGKAITVVVSYTDHPDIKNGLLFAEAGMQVAGGVPLMCGEPADFSTFRIGLFGLSKLTNIDDTVGKLETVIGDVTSRSRK